MMAEEQPVAWMYTHPTDGCITHTKRRHVHDGWTEAPLYTRPSTPPAVSDGLEEVLLDILDRHSMRVCSGKGDFNLKDEILSLIRCREQQAAEALKPFADCCDQIAESESDEEWAKFRLLIGDYRRARDAIRAALEASHGRVG